MVVFFLKSLPVNYPVNVQLTDCVLLSVPTVRLSSSRIPDQLGGRHSAHVGESVREKHSKHYNFSNARDTVENKRACFECLEGA